MDSVGNPHPARFRTKRTREVDLHANNLEFWQQDYVQTSSGVFDGQVRELWAGAMQAFDEVANCATRQHCRPWEGGIWLGLSALEQPAGLRFMGHTVSGFELMISDACESFAMHVPANHGLYGLVIDSRELYARLHQADASPHATGTGTGARVLAITPSQRFRLTGLLREVFRSLEATPTVLSHEASRRGLKEALFDTVEDIFARERPAAPLSTTEQRQQDLVHRAHELVQEHPHDYLDVDTLCAHLHVTRRTLQNCFQKCLGMSPAHYLRIVRLNAVRRQLRSGSSQQSIGDVAARWGFWHLGHFSHHYKALFGETPRQTRPQA